VVPFAMVGVDDMWDVIADADDAIYAPARALARRASVDPELLFPLIRGLGPTPLPRPQRIYARIGAAIAARDYGSSWDDAAAAARLRDAVRAAVSGAIAELLAERRSDPARRLLPRLAGQASRLTRSQAAALRALLPGAPGQAAGPGAREVGRRDHGPGVS
jgi:hypothetical protein